MVGLFRSVHPHVTEMLLQLQRNQQWLPESHPLSLFAPVVATNLCWLMKQLATKKAKTQKNPQANKNQNRVSDSNWTPWYPLFAGVRIGSLRHSLTGMPRPLRWVPEPLENGKHDEGAEENV